MDGGIIRVGKMWAMIKYKQNVAVDFSSIISHTWTLKAIKLFQTFLYKTIKMIRKVILTVNPCYFKAYITFFQNYLFRNTWIMQFYKIVYILSLFCLPLWFFMLSLLTLILNYLYCCWFIFWSRIFLWRCWRIHIEAIV